MKFQLLRRSRFSLKMQLVVMNLLLNLRTCWRGNQVSSFFTSVEPPSMAEYIANANNGVLLEFHLRGGRLPV